MKKLFSLLLALVMALGVLTACGIKGTTFGKYLNVDYNTHADLVQSLTLIQDLEGYTVNASNDEFVVFKKVDTESADTLVATYKVIALRSGNIISTFTDTLSTTTVDTVTTITSTNYSFELIGNVPAIKVQKVDTTSTATEPIDTKTNYTLYDATGAAVMSQEASFSLTTTFNDWAIFDDVVYTVNKESGALTKKFTTPVNFKNISNYEINDTYIYVESNDDILVYDHDFKVVAVWSTPANSSVRSWFALNDGNVFIQYDKELEPDEKKYDYYVGNSLNNMIKYDLVTEIYNIEKKKSKDIDFEYILNQGISRYSLNKSVDGEEIYADDAFENVVVVSSIIDKKEDNSDARRDFLVINNKGKVKTSLKLVEYQTALPRKISAEKYLVSTLYGTAIVNAEGEVLTQYNSANFVQVGDYFVDTNNKYGIYDMSFNVVYDYSEKNNASYYGQLNDTIFVKEYIDEKKEDYKIIAFAKGTQFDVCTYDKDGTTNLTLNIVGNAGIYSLYNPQTKEYTYYNADGTSLMTNSAEISSVISVNENICVLTGVKMVTPVGSDIPVPVAVYFIAK